MFQAQHFPKKLPTNEFTFDTINKRLEGIQGDDINIYRPGPIISTGQRLRCKDCRARKIKQVKNNKLRKFDDIDEKEL